MGKRLASMAWRNLWRHRRRTLITLSSIAFGAFIAVIMTGIGDSQWPKMINLAARMGGGHVTLQHPDYQDRPALKRSVRNAAGEPVKVCHIFPEPQGRECIEDC